jgi:hypothetical protein
MDDLHNDEFLQSAVSDFTRTRRLRLLQLSVGAMLIFAFGFLAGASYQYQTQTITLEFRESTPPVKHNVSETTKT